MCISYYRSMKVQAFVVPKPENQGLVYQIDTASRFYDQLHSHEEIQISLIVKGEGDLLVGDSVRDFCSDDVFVIGGNLPHLFRSNDFHEQCEMVSLFFTPETFGERFFSLNDTEILQPLFDEMRFGLSVQSKQDVIADNLIGMNHENGIERIVSFLKILMLILESKRDKLATFLPIKPLNEEEGSRLNRVMNLAMDEFKRQITLDEVASVANMTPNAFCRYFKQRTNKRFFQFLQEIRIGHACTLLRSSDLTISEISDQCGYNNISNFNRSFKAQKQTTPREYKARLIQLQA